MFYPIFLNLKGKRIVVIGGGDVAERKVGSLLETEAAIAVVSPEATPGLTSLAAARRIDLQKRTYVKGDCDDAVLVLSATDDPEVSKAVWEDAVAAGVMVNTADQPEFCDFIMPAVVRRAELTVAISTGGASPALAARLKDKISDLLGPEYERLIDLLAHARQEIRQRIPQEGDRKALHYRIVDSDVLKLLQQGNIDGANRRLREIIEDFACQEKTS